MEGVTSQLAGPGYHRPVCVETVVGSSIIFRWRGGADNNNNPNDLSHVNLWDKPVETILELSFLDPGNLD